MRWTGEDWTELGVQPDGEPLGAPAYHPRALLSVWLYGFMTNVRSCRGQVPGRGVRVRHPDCTAQAAVDRVIGASCSASCFVVTPGVR